MAEKKPTMWGTHYGTTMEISKLSHQHLSNIWYYFHIVLETKPPMVIIEELANRFGCVRLPYHPLISFRYEIDALVSKGYTTGEPNADIIDKGFWIGKIKYE